MLHVEGIPWRGDKGVCKIANESFRIVTKFRYLEVVAVNQNYIMKRKLKLGSAYYCSFQKVLFCHPVSKSLKLKILQHYNSSYCFVWV